MVAPESLLLEIASGNTTVERMIANAPPLLVPFDTLADVDGWTVDLSSSEPGAAFDDPAAAPEQRIINAGLVQLEYAIRRGAVDPASALLISKREGPIGVIGDHELLDSLSTLFDIGEAAGRRNRGHMLMDGVRADPAISFEHHDYDQQLGQNSLSSFVVHTDGERDGISITGAPSDRWGVEIGLGSATPLADLVGMEAEIARFPSFLSGLRSELEDGGIIVSWGHDKEPDFTAVAQALYAWTHALFDQPLVDLRIVFGPRGGRSALLTDMRSRARAFRLYRDAVLAGDPDPERVVEQYWQGRDTET